MKLDQRKTMRKVLRTNGTVALEGIAPYPIHTLDMTLVGVCIGTARQLTVGQHLQLDFNILLNGKKHHIAVLAKVIHCVCGGDDGFRAGLQFIEIDSESAAIVAKFMNT